jgi:hypothetical protein
MPWRDKELGPLVRGVFQPEEGEVWAKADASQQEFRLLVHCAARLDLPGAKEAAAQYRDNPDPDYHAIVAGMTGTIGPAIVALVTDGVDATPQAIHRTFLAYDGRHKGPADSPKMMLGPCRGGVLTPSRPLMVGEGIETCLSRYC